MGFVWGDLSEGLSEGFPLSVDLDLFDDEDNDNFLFLSLSSLSDDSDD